MRQLPVNPDSVEPTDAHLSSDRSRTERFETAYNRIDRELQRVLNEPREGRRRGFTSLVRQIGSERRHFGRHLDFLLEAGELRNAIVHNRFGDVEYIAVPTELTVAKLEAIDEELRKPIPLRSLAAREVVTVDSTDPIGKVLNLVHSKGFVRFPVRRDGRIVALLTASGIMRWIASHDLESCAIPAAKGAKKASSGALDQSASNADSDSIVCAIASVSVGEALSRDHRKDEYAVLPRDATADDALSLWTKNPRLEAVILTEHGKIDEMPVGIATATDLIKLLDLRP